MIDNSVKNALIVGGGIAGLSAAVALSGRSIATTVVELHGRTDGASIGITNRAVFALEELGVLEACTEAGFALAGGGTIFDRMYDRDGQPLPVRPPGPRVDSRLPFAVTIYRPKLGEILRERAEALGAMVRVGLTVTALRNLADRVDVEFSDGTSGSYDLVIGADGVHSKIRSMIHEASVQPKYTGHMSFRVLLRNGPTVQPGFYMLSDSQLVVVGKLPGEITYLALGIDMQNRRVEPAEARQIVDGILAQYTMPYFAKLRHALDAEQPNVISRPFEWILVPAPWHRGRVTLIGDAAHSSTAHLSSGGGMALEDSCVLAQELARTSDLAAALDAFMTRRMPRVQLVVESGVKLTELQQQKAPPEASGPIRGRAIAALSTPY